MSSNKNNKEEYQLVQVSVGGQITLEGNLSTPKNAQGIVLSNEIGKITNRKLASDNL